jgi:hypothetical protein
MRCNEQRQAPSRLQSLRPVGRVAELGAFGHIPHTFMRHRSNQFLIIAALIVASASIVRADIVIHDLGSTGSRTPLQRARVYV